MAAYNDEQKDRKYHSHLKNKLGISLVEAQRLAAVPACEVCGASDTRLNVDHDHETGEVRGVLCSYCNIAVGVLEGDADWLARLQRHIEGRPQLKLVSG